MAYVTLQTIKTTRKFTLIKPRLEEGRAPRLTNVDFLLRTKVFKRSTWIHYFGGAKCFSCQKTQTGF